MESFKCKKQHYEDLVRTIERVRPVVELLRVLAKSEEERLRKINKITVLSKDIDSINGLIENISIKKLQKELKVVYDKYKLEVYKLQSDLDDFVFKLINIREEIGEYQEYSNSFYIDKELIDKIFKFTVTGGCTTEDFFTILFLLYNVNIRTNYNLKNYAIKYSKYTEDALKKDILKNLQDDFTQDNICEMIKKYA